MLGRTIVTIAALFAAGAILMALGHRLRNIPSTQRIEDWVKYGVYLLIILTLVVVAWAGRWTTALLLASITVAGSIVPYLGFILGLARVPAETIKNVCTAVGYIVAIPIGIAITKSVLKKRYSDFRIALVAK